MEEERNILRKACTIKINLLYLYKLIFSQWDSSRTHSSLTVRRASQNWCSSLLYRKARSKTENGLHSWSAPHSVWDKTASGTARSKTSVLLFAVPEAVLAQTKARRSSVVQGNVQFKITHFNIQLYFTQPKYILKCPICKAIEGNSHRSFTHKLHITIQWNVYCSVNSGKNTIYRVQLTTCTMLYSLHVQLQWGDMQQSVQHAVHCTVYMV